MAISGQQNIRIGAENESANSDSLHTAFTKIQQNFNNLFSNGSQFVNFNSDTGISIVKNATLGNVTIKNTGVVNMIEGTGIRLSGSNGDVVISISGDASGNLVAGVTKVGVYSNTLAVQNSPIISEGNILVELSEVDTINAGTYTAPTVKVDQYGRITEIANTISTGTVSNIVVTAGQGIEVTGSPVTTTGNILINNTGVLRLTAGPGISLSSGNGNVTVSATTTQVSGTVTRVGVLSNSLTVTQSPITTTGNISIELPNSATFSGDVEANNVVTSNNVSVAGNIETDANLTVSGTTNVGTFISTNGGNNSAGTSTAVTITTNNQAGGTGYAGILTMTNTTSGATNPNKYVRLNTTGNLEIVNSDYSATIFSLSNAGNLSGISKLTVSGNANVANIGSSGVIVATGNVTGGNLVTSGSIVATGNANVANVNATGNVNTANISANILTANFFILGNTSLPTGTIPDGTIALDAANLQIAVRISGAWKYATLS